MRRSASGFSDQRVGRGVRRASECARGRRLARGFAGHAGAARPRVVRFAGRSGRTGRIDRPGRGPATPSSGFEVDPRARQPNRAGRFGEPVGDARSLHQAGSEFARIINESDYMRNISSVANRGLEAGQRLDPHSFVNRRLISPAVASPPPRPVQGSRGVRSGRGKVRRPDTCTAAGGGRAGREREGVTCKSAEFDVSRPQDRPAGLGRGRARRGIAAPGGGHRPLRERRLRLRPDQPPHRDGSGTGDRGAAGGGGPLPPRAARQSLPRPPSSR